eukprot:2976795-Pleurochrysis_carterae.AAC.1
MSRNRCVTVSDERKSSSQRYRYLTTENRKRVKGTRPSSWPRVQWKLLMWRETMRWRRKQRAKDELGQNALEELLAATNQENEALKIALKIEQSAPLTKKAFKPNCSFGKPLMDGDYDRGKWHPLIPGHEKRLVYISVLAAKLQQMLHSTYCQFIFDVSFKLA